MIEVVMGVHDILNRLLGTRRSTSAMTASDRVSFCGASTEAPRAA
jgi:hypothetical protein